MIFLFGADCSFCISAKQLHPLKIKLGNTKTQLQANNVQNLTGEQISGDILTATIWSWFAAAESHNRLSQNQAGMVESPGLSYGLFHAVADPIYSWGVVRQVKFPGVNMDIGHVRNITWAKDNDEKKWVAYNRLRGQYMSALEHAVPERFFNDPQKCNLQGASNPTAGLPDCPQGISAVKALGIAAAQGQRIYTITQKVYNDNPGIVSNALSAHSWDTQNRVQQSLDAGYEVTIHERPITESGWTGAGYTQIDPATGAGAYTIEGGSNGGVILVFVFVILFAFFSILFPLLAGASALWVTGGFSALNFFLGCLVDPSSDLSFYTGLLTFAAMLMAFALLSSTLFLGAVFISGFLAMLSAYGAFSSPGESRLTCRILGLG